MPPTTSDRAPVKTDDTRRITFYLTEAERRELLSRMARDGETSITRFLVGALGLGDRINEEAAAL